MSAAIFFKEETKMAGKAIIAFIYDFDKTLSPRDMQEYGFIPELGMTSEKFWKLCNEGGDANAMDPILAYMWTMVREAEGKMLLNRAKFESLGQSVELFEGVESWFERVNDYADKRGLSAEHYIISSGLTEIIEGTVIAKNFKKIYAGEFMYNERGVPVWPARTVNYTNKTQFLFRINKGVLDPCDHDALNNYTPQDERRVPFRNMIYIGDGLTDVPSMKVVREYGGRSIAVYTKQTREVARRMLRYGRADFILPADYSEGTELEKTVKMLIEGVSAYSKAANLHLEQLKSLEKGKK